jgi:hypothetical protein
MAAFRDDRFDSETHYHGHNHRHEFDNHVTRRVIKIALVSGSVKFPSVAPGSFLSPRPVVLRSPLDESI